MEPGEIDDRQDSPRILVADDDPVVRELLKSIIEDEGWRCELVVDGAEAVSRIERELFDVVITDLQMPHLDGIEVLRKVKEHSSHTEVIILTGFSSETAAIHALRLGAFDFLKKPLADIDKLVTLIRAAREKQRKAMEEALALVELHKEADELDRLRSRLEKEAWTDPLTGLYNRKQFEETLMAWFTQAEAGGACFSLLLIDLDDFRGLNERLGHPGGDFVLKQVGALLQQSIRENDYAFRFGGEEFTVLLHGADLDAARRAAERIRAGVQRMRLRWEDLEVGLTVSIGLTSFPRCRAPNTEELIRLADQAMYQAKGKGKNRVEASSR